MTPQAQPPVAQPEAPAPQAYAPAPAPQAYAPAPQPAPQAYAPQPAPQAYAPQPAPAPMMQPPVAPPAYAQQPAYAPQPGYAPQAPAYAQQAFHRINHQRLAEEGMPAPGSAANAQTEEFRIVKRALLQNAEDLRRQGAGTTANRIMVTSAHPGEGKTYCAISLALSIAAEKDVEVLLVDLDMARYSVLSTLGLPNGPGLIDAIADPRADVRNFVMATDMPGLSVLSGGRPTASDAEYLASARAGAVLDQLLADKPNRIILFDTPPALAASLPAEVAKQAGQVVLVVLADKTNGSAVQDAASLLSACPNVQLLLNAVQFSPSGRRFGNYHGYRG
ncbi:capsular biosynthesis protein [Novosphingobium sp. FSY-8]|uniref:Capsular biosynthesis protein n=1 Tax=Novosphingobium ovatum TaxID=1908523 RepID=A0ABW9XC09_9SPHN|nr:capsular biosynthesis protein [Novosphingobium ovatum]